MSYGWEGNRRSDSALAMRYRLKWFMHLQAQGLSKGDEHPTYTPPLHVCLSVRVICLRPHDMAASSCHWWRHIALPHNTFFR